MLINNKPRAFLMMHCQSQPAWSESNKISELLSEFDIEEDSWREFWDVIASAESFGRDCSEVKTYADFPGDDAVKEILQSFRATDNYRDALEVASDDECKQEDIDALCALAEESLVNSFYYALKCRK